MAGTVLLSSRWILDSRVHALLSSCQRCSILYFLEEGGEQRVAYMDAGDPVRLVRWSSKGVVGVFAADWPCALSFEVIGGHTPAWVMVCSMRVTREMSITASPPRPLRRNDRLVLAGYARRLIGEGASLERIAARMVIGGGSPASLLAVVSEQERRIPVGIMAARRLCIVHTGHWAAASTASMPGCTLLEDAVVVVKLQAGVPRIEVRDLTRYR